MEKWKNGGREYGATDLTFFLSMLERDLIWDFGMSGWQKEPMRAEDVITNG